MKPLELNRFTRMSREESQSVEGGTEYLIALQVLSKTLGLLFGGFGGGCKVDDDCGDDGHDGGCCVP